MKVEGSNLIDIVIDIGDFELCCDGDLVGSKDTSGLVCLCSPHLVEVTLSLKEAMTMKVSMLLGCVCNVFQWMELSCLLIS